MLDRRRRVEIAQTELVEAIKDRIMTLIMEKLREKKIFEEIIQQITNREINPFTAAEKILQEVMK